MNTTYTVNKTIDIRGVIETCYGSGDSELIDLFHVIAPASVKDCAEKTIKDLVEANVEMYTIRTDNGDNALIAYFGKEVLQGINFLTGFFIMPEHRNDEGRKAFWVAVRSVMDAEFFSMVHPKNIRAVKFLLKEGSVTQKESNFVIFKIKGE